MALFDFLKRSKREERDAKKRRERFVAQKDTEIKPVEKQQTVPVHHPDVTPHVSEKATDLHGRHIYTFDVTPSYNKSMIKQHIERTYKVTPERVHTVRIPGKRVFVGRRRVYRPGYKKALVYLKEGESIPI